MQTMTGHQEKMRRLKPLALAAMLALLGGCAVGPDYRRPALPESQAYAPAPLPETSASAPVSGGEAQSFVAGRDIPFEWWKAYGSPALDALVERAFKANPGLPAAQAALRQAQELVYAQRGYFSPTVGLGYSFERQQLAGNQGGNSPGIQGNGSTIQTTQNPDGPAPYNGPVIYNFHTAQLTVGYTPDVFGANRRQVESLEAQQNLAYYQLQAAYLTLASNVVAAAIQEASLRAQIAQTESIIAANEKSLQILQRQLAAGYAMRLDVAAQETALAQAKQTLPPLRKQLEQTRDLIRTLAGQPPDAEVEQRFELADLHLPQELPVSLPSKLVDQRPDVRAAEEQLRSANAQVGAAVAARLPQFAISGAAGGAASQFDWMFRNGGPFWNLIASVTQNVFDGNTLLHRERAADAALQQAAAQYQSTVLAAYQNVADALHALHADADALVAADQAQRAAKISLDLTRRQLELGQVNGLTLITAELAYRQAAISLVQAQALRLGDTAALFQALGGGWWNRSEVARGDAASVK